MIPYPFKHIADESIPEYWAAHNDDNLDDVILVVEDSDSPATVSDMPSASQERDPFGRSQHEPGAKVDAGKAEFDMVLFSFSNALAYVDRIGKFGARKYTKGGFLSVPNGQQRYFNAEMRHAIKHQQGELLDPDSGELHLAHKAWNALAELELFLREQSEKK